MEEQKLERKYGLFTAIAMVVGIVIGSGVFFKAQTVLEKTKGNLSLGILAWLVGLWQQNTKKLTVLSTTQKRWSAKNTLTRSAGL